MTGMTNEEHLIEANELLREELDDARAEVDRMERRPLTSVRVAYIALLVMTVVGASKGEDSRTRTPCLALIAAMFGRLATRDTSTIILEGTGLRITSMFNRFAPSAITVEAGLAERSHTTGASAAPSRESNHGRQDRDRMV